jgi:hypothetical protein
LGFFIAIFFVFIKWIGRVSYLSSNIIEMSEEECLAEIERVAKRMNGRGDRNDRAEKGSLMDYVLDGLNSNEQITSKKFDAGIRRYLGKESE